MVHTADPYKNCIILIMHTAIQGFIKNACFPYGHFPSIDVDKHHDGSPSRILCCKFVMLCYVFEIKTYKYQMCNRPTGTSTAKNYSLY